MDVLSSVRAALFICIHFCLALFYVTLLATFYVLGYFEETYYPTWYWILVSITAAGSCHSVSYILYNGCKKYLHSGDCQETDEEYTAEASSTEVSALQVGEKQSDRVEFIVSTRRCSRSFIQKAGQSFHIKIMRTFFRD